MDSSFVFCFLCCGFEIVFVLQSCSLVCCSSCVSRMVFHCSLSSWHQLNEFHLIVIYLHPPPCVFRSMCSSVCVICEMRFSPCVPVFVCLFCSKTFLFCGVLYFSLFHCLVQVSLNFLKTEITLFHIA